MNNEFIYILAISNFAKSRIGKQLRRALVEQRYPDKLFISFPHNEYSRWIPANGDEHWKIIPEEQ